MSQLIEVVLTNRFAQIDADGDLRDKLSKFWSYYQPGYYHTALFKLRMNAIHMAKREGLEVNEDELPGWDGRRRMMRRKMIPAGLFRATRAEAASELGVKFSVTYELPHVDIEDIEPIDDPKYQYQEDCIKVMCKAVRRGGGLVCAATRTGKTAITARFFQRMPYRCLFLVDQKDLLYQNAEEMEKWLGEKVGVVGDSRYEIERVTVATIQTVQRHIDDLKFRGWYRSIQIVVMDEVHEQLNRRSFRVVEELKPIATYGITATLQIGRKDVRLRAYSFAGPIIFQFPVAEGIKQGVLTDGRCVQLLFEPEEQPLTVDYQNEYRIQVIENERKANVLNALVSSLVMAGRYVMVLAERVEHVEDISARLRGVQHRVAYGRVKQTERKESMEEFETGDVKLIIANKVFKKGITIKRLDAVIDVAEMKSKNDALQKFGRGLGLHEDKDELLYIDFGTYGGARFHKAARSRMRALKQAGIDVKVVKVRSAAQAIKAVFKCIKKVPVSPEAEQLSLIG